MTRVEVSAFSKALVDERMVTYRAGLQEQLQTYLQSQAVNGIPSLTPGNEIAELDAWYSSLAEPTSQQRTTYFAVKANIARMMGE